MGWASCSVPGCRSRRTETNKVTLFKFPKDKVQASLWFRACGLEESEKEGAVCTLHFGPELMCTNSSGRKYLVRGSVPTLNLPQPVSRSELMAKEHISSVGRLEREASESSGGDAQTVCGHFSTVPPLFTNSQQSLLNLDDAGYSDRGEIIYLSPDEESFRKNGSDITVVSNEGTTESVGVAFLPRAAAAAAGTCELLGSHCASSESEESQRNGTCTSAADSFPSREVSPVQKCDGIIKEWIQQMHAICYPRILEEVPEILKGLIDGKGPSDCLAPAILSGWLDAFLHRHRDVAGFMNVDEKVRTEREWFTHFVNYLYKNHIDLDVFLSPQNGNRVYNFCEVTIQIEMSCDMLSSTAGEAGKSPEVFFGKEPRKSSSMPSGTLAMSFMLCVNASGEFVEPSILCNEAASHLWLSVHPHKLEEALFLSPSSVFKEDEVFLAWIKQFDRMLSKRHVKRPVLLLLSSEPSYITYSTATFCQRKNLILYCLPKVCVGVVDPLEVVIKKLKALCIHKIKSCIRDGGNPVTTLLSLLISTKWGMFSKEVVHAFMKAGLIAPTPGLLPNVAAEDMAFGSSFLESDKKLQEIAKERSLLDSFLKYVETFIADDILPVYKERFRNKVYGSSGELLYDIWCRTKLEIQQVRGMEEALWFDVDRENRNDFQANLN